MRRILALALIALPAFAQIPDGTRTSIDDIAHKVLAESHVPAASIAVVKDGKIAYVQAYGDAKLDPKTPATPSMRFKIASNSKQIAAAATLLLAEENKLSLDDHVSRFLPGLTRANEVTIRELLSHTSGYQDYFPLDYVAPFMARSITPAGILDTWAKKPLDFDPGTRWQYSNTNYVIIGQIIEKITGKPLIEFLRTRIFNPLGMRSAIDESLGHWSESDPRGYQTFALGPARPAVPEGDGWMYAAGELAMTAEDLARWDISLMNGAVLKPASLKELTTEVLLKSGTGTRYALGLDVSTNNEGHRRWSHGGEASGFISQNVTLPDDHIAVTVLTNGQGRAAPSIERQIEELLLAPAIDPQAAPALEHAKQLFSGLQKGQLNKTLLTGDAIAYFTDQAISDFASSLGPLGEPSSFTQTNHEGRGGMMERTFSIRAGGKALSLVTYIMPDGKFAQYMIDPVPAAR
ncbi:MAG TPA: serine hydrolase domain-containing protein [Bryobacteraceae bacterium]|jgi:CubicO group peptidase (beta-lactamase class C family)|nr:serine hydrolase domain-containing protein [Bryobacteraceae bacterium]